jgi:hypothetical protein
VEGEDNHQLLSDGRREKPERNMQEDQHLEEVEHAYSGRGVEESKEMMEDEVDRDAELISPTSNFSQTLREMEDELNAPLLSLQVETLVEAHLKSITQTTMRSLLREQF